MVQFKVNEDGGVTITLSAEAKQDLSDLLDLLDLDDFDLDEPHKADLGNTRFALQTATA